jgi:dynein heavy chain
MFGLHPNAEIGYLTSTSEELFNQIMQVQGGGSTGGKGRKEDVAKVYIDKFLELLPEDFLLLEITGRVQEFTPYVVVAI